MELQLEPLQIDLDEINKKYGRSYIIINTPTGGDVREIAAVPEAERRAKTLELLKLNFIEGKINTYGSLNSIMPFEIENLPSDILDHLFELYGFNKYIREFKVEPRLRLIEALDVIRRSTANLADAVKIMAKNKSQAADAVKQLTDTQKRVNNLTEVLANARIRK